MFKRRLRGKDIRGCEHEQSIVNAPQPYILGAGQGNFDIAPLIHRRAMPGMFCRCWADLDTHHFAGSANSLDEGRKRAALTTANVKHPVALVQTQQYRGPLPYRLDETEIEVRKRPHQAGQEADVERC